jgi:prepilin peptidase CpaA
MIPMLHFALLLIFPALVIVGGLRDAVSYTIPNWVSLALVAAFPVAALVLGAPLGLIGVNFAVAAAALVVGMGMFAMGWVGGGDAKLFAAAALWLGLPALLPYLFVTCLAGGALTFGLLGLRSPWLRPLVLSGPSWMVRLAEPGESVPYGLAIAVGALTAFPSAPLLKDLVSPF